jgi:hypothetical protein
MKTNHDNSFSLSSCFPDSIQAASNTGHQLRENKDWPGCCWILFLLKLRVYLIRSTAVAELYRVSEAYVHDVSGIYFLPLTEI